MRRIFPLLALLAAMSLPATAFAAGESPPISTVQLEKLVKRIETKGQNANLTSPVTRALGLGDGTSVLVKSINSYISRNGRHYTFGLVVGAGYYLATVSDGSSPHVFLLDQDLRIVKALKTGFGLEPMEPAEAATETHDVLQEFANFIEIN
jgi:hypothetical protein